MWEVLLCGDGLDSRAEAGFVAAGRMLVQDALLDTLVNHRNGGAIGALGSFFVALGDGLLEGTERAAKARLIGAVARGLGLGLARTLQRRKMVRHTLL